MHPTGYQSRDINPLQIKEFLDSISSLFSRLEALPTGVRARIYKDLSIKAILFDIYGTLLISEAGDIGTSALSQNSREATFAMHSSHETREYPINTIKSLLFDSIRKDHRETRTKLPDIKFPEVDIVKIWDTVFQSLGFRDYDISHLGCTAIHFEILINQVALMPGVLRLFDFLKDGNIVLGIVSNAQFYTPILLEYLSGRDLGAWGFDPDCLSWSYKAGCGKPDSLIFHSPLQYLHARGIKNEEILYLGNDMLNDIGCARSLGLKTALFAGDKRSLRLRKDDPELTDIEPDFILNDLLQIQEILQEG